MNNYIGKAKLKVNDSVKVANITEDGYAVFEDGKTVKLSDEQFEKIKECVAQKEREIFQSKTLGAPYLDDIEQPVVEKKENQGSGKSGGHKKQKGASKGAIFFIILLSCITFLLTGILLSIVMDDRFGILTEIRTSIGISALPEVEPTPTPLPTPEPTPEPTPTPVAPQPTIDMVSQADRIVIYARITTPEGEEKDVVLGYFTTDDTEGGTLEDSLSEPTSE